MYSLYHDLLLFTLLKFGKVHEFSKTPIDEFTELPGLSPRFETDDSFFQNFISFRKIITSSLVVEIAS